jgi:hypothetical protein
MFLNFDSSITRPAFIEANPKLKHAALETSRAADNKINPVTWISACLLKT